MTDPSTEGFGLLVLDKPTGITSHSAVRRAARHFGVKRAGHAGTLDPLASGVLLIGLGRATRLLEYLVGHDKCYRARIRLGETRDTLDREGRVLERRPVEPFPFARVDEALACFRGRIEQVPPAYSAIKVAGQPLYRRARRGEDVAVPPRTVEITRLELLSWEPPDLVVELECSSGTYVRSVARDLGALLGTGGTLWELVRLRSGPFTLRDAVSLEGLDEAGASAVTHLLPPERMTASLPSLGATPEEIDTLASGRALLNRGEEGDGDRAVFDDGGRLVAIGRTCGGELRPLKVFVAPRPKPESLAA